MSDFDLLGCCTPTATLDSEIQPTVKGRRTSLSIFSLITSSNTDGEKDKDAEKDTDEERHRHRESGGCRNAKLGSGFGLL